MRREQLSLDPGSALARAGVFTCPPAKAGAMWAHIYRGICWLVGSTETDRMPDRERIVTSDVDPIRTVEDSTPERCDGCGAESKVVWEHDAAQLWLCDHHSRTNTTGLHGRGWTSRRVVVPA